MEENMACQVLRIVFHRGRKFAILIFILGIMQGCEHEHLPYYYSPDFTPLWPGETQFSADTLHRVAAFSFTDQDGRVIDNDFVKGKIYVANFFFTACPGICPKMTTNLVAVQEAFSSDPDILILSHSVMPWADSVARLKEFSDLYGIDHSKWKLLTGSKNEIYSLARTSYFAEEVAGFTRDSTDFIHTEHCLLVDREGHLRGLYNGTLPLEVERLIEDIRILSRE